MGGGKEDRYDHKMIAIHFNEMGRREEKKTLMSFVSMREMGGAGVIIRDRNFHRELKTSRKHWRHAHCARLCISGIPNQ